MELLNKIKLNYSLKLFQDYVSNNKFDDAYRLIEDSKKKGDKNFFLLLKNCQQLLHELPPECYKKKIIWTISYDTADIYYINKFLDFYLPLNLNYSYQIQNFVSSLNQFFTGLNPESLSKDIEFNDFLSQSNFYQNLLLFKSDKDYLILETCAAFFETINKTFFIYPNITFCYFYVINNPEKLMLKYRQKNNSTEASYDELFNFNDKQYLNSDQKDLSFKIYENRKNYNVNVKSWTDENVLNTYKGKIIYYENLLENTTDVLIEIIYHLKQYGMSVNINMDDIQRFVLDNKPDKNIDGNLSNNDKKFLNKNIDETLLLNKY